MNYEKMILLELLEELEKAEQDGVPLILDGYPSSPMQITKACMIREEGSYMRDYLGDEEGNVKEIRFDRISDH